MNEMTQEEARIRASNLVSGYWVNSAPLSMSELLGKAVLVDFWDYTCVNCIHTLRYVPEWRRRYAQHGLVWLPAFTAPDDAGEDAEFKAELTYAGMDAPGMYRLIKNQEIGPHGLTLTTGAPVLALCACTFVSCVAPESQGGAEEKRCRGAKPSCRSFRGRMGVSPRCNFLP